MKRSLVYSGVAAALFGFLATAAVLFLVRVAKLEGSLASACRSLCDVSG